LTFSLIIIFKKNWDLRAGAFLIWVERGRKMNCIDKLIYANCDSDVS
jgi:hypothetical protein